MTAILLREIIVLYLMLICGVVLVKTRLLRAADSRILSVLCIYLVQPVVIIRAFQIEMTAEVAKGFLLALAAALLLHIALIAVVRLIARAYPLKDVEKASLIYANAGGLIIPLVTAMFGENWVIYGSAFICVQLCFIWSHGISLISGERGVKLGKILRNCNVISIIVGLVLALLHIRLPDLLQSAMSQLSALMGPLNMLIIGMLLAEADLKRVLSDKGIWVTALLKMVLIPLLMLIFLKVSHLTSLVPEGPTILLISYMAVTTPSANMVTQLALLHQRDSETASAINVLTSLICLVTMPLMISLYIVWMM